MKVNTESCKSMKIMLDMIDTNMKENRNIELNQKLYKIVNDEYYKQCIFKEVKSVHTIDIQQWYDSK